MVLEKPKWISPVSHLTNIESRFIIERRFVFFRIFQRRKIMAQVLKEEVRNRILDAAENVFFEKDYRSAKLSEIAKLANVPVALIYTYFDNKENLFDATVGSVYSNFCSALQEEEALEKGSPLERFDKVGQSYIRELLKDRKKLIVLMDRSSGTRHEKAKFDFILQMQKHIEIGLKRQTKKKYDPMLAHILASNFTESLLEIARHYQSREWAENMLKLVAQCYYNGVESL